MDEEEVIEMKWEREGDEIGKRGGGEETGKWRERGKMGKGEENREERAGARQSV